MVSIALEVTLALVHVPPGIDFGAKKFSDSSYVDVLVFISFFKLYILARLMKNSSPLNTNGARFIGSFTKVEYGNWFLVKVWLKANPLLSLILSWVFIIFVSAYLLYLSERRYPVDCSTQAADFSEYKNSVWCIVMTVLTVGYGDLAAATFLGRTISIVATFLGLVWTATLIGSVSDYLNLNNEEFVVINFIDEHKKISMYETVALNCIKLAIHVFVCKHKKRDVNAAVEDMETEVNKFRYYRQ